MFTIFEEKYKILEIIQEQLNEQVFPEEEEQIYKDTVENSFLRRLIQILKLPTLQLSIPEAKRELTYPWRKRRLKEVFLIVFGKLCYPRLQDNQDKLQFNSILHRCIWMRNARYREALMSIALLCKENHIQNFVTNIDDVEQLLHNLTPNTLKFLDECYETNKALADVKQVELYSQDKL